MDLYDITQLAVVATTALVLGRIGWALARLIDRRAARTPVLADDAVERLRVLEEEHLSLRRELAELQERQDFTERALLRDPGRKPAAPGPVPDRIVTPR